LAHTLKQNILALPVLVLKEGILPIQKVFFLASEFVAFSNYRLRSRGSAHEGPAPSY
jgi:hypothetical protein